MKDDALAKEGEAEHGHEHGERVVRAPRGEEGLDEEAEGREETVDHRLLEDLRDPGCDGVKEGLGFGG